MSGNLEIWRSGDLEIQKIEVQTIKKMTILKIQIRSAKNVGKAWIGRKKILPAPFGGHPRQFVHEPKKIKKTFKMLHIFLGGPMGPIYPVGVMCLVQNLLQEWVYEKHGC